MIKNYTPHDISVILNWDLDENFVWNPIRKCFNLKDPSKPYESKVFHPEGIARCKTSDRIIDQIDTIPLLGISFGEIEGLPKEQEETYYIVSSLVANAGRKQGRKDLLVPSWMLRDDQGNILGCLALAIE